jgi:hypothetical protein
MVAGEVLALRSCWGACPVVQTVGSVPCERFDDLVDRSVQLVRVMTGCQFALGDIALEIAPLRTHGGDMRLGEDDELGW